MRSPDRSRCRLFRSLEAFRELGLAAAGDVDRDQRLPFFGRDEGGDLAPVGGEDAVGLRAVGQLASLRALPGPIRFTQRPWSRRNSSVWPSPRDVFDVGRADAARPATSPSSRCGASCRRRRRRPALRALAAAEEDAAGEVAGLELVDAAGPGQAGQATAGRADRVEVLVVSAAGGRGRRRSPPSGENSASWSSAAPLVRRAGRRLGPGPCRGRPGAAAAAAARRRRSGRSGETTGAESSSAPLVSRRWPEPSGRTE